MHRRVVVQIHFQEEKGQCLPVAASTRRRGTGARVTVEVEREAVETKAIYVLYRLGRACVVIAGSVLKDRVETALEKLGEAGTAYRIARIPVDGGGASAFT